MIVAIGLVFSLLYGPEGALFAAQFKPEEGYTGISVGVQVSGASGGGLAPLVATSLLAFGNRNPLYIICHLMVLGVIALFAVRAMKSISEPTKASGRVASTKHFAEQRVQSSEV